VKEQLIAMVAEKAGLDTGKAEQAVEAVLGYLQQHPGQLKSLLGTDPGGLVRGMKDKGPGGLFKR
jgi:hypothetical protein